MSPEPSTSTHGRSSQGLRLSKGRRLCSGAGLGSSAPCLLSPTPKPSADARGSAFGLDPDGGHATLASGPGRGRVRHGLLRRPLCFSLDHCPLRMTFLKSTHTCRPAHRCERLFPGWRGRRGTRQAEGWGKRLGHTEPQSPEGAGERCGGRGTQGAHRQRTASTRRSQTAWNPCSAPGTFLGTGEAEGARDP